jgi:hypothetical protein
MKPLDARSPGLKSVIPVADEKHTSRELAKMWIGCKLPLKLLINRCPMRALVLLIFVSHGPLFTIFIAYGNIKNAGAWTVSMGKICLQSFDVATKCWSNKGHGHHPAQRNIKMRCLFWRNPHQLNTLDRVKLLQLLEFVLIVLEWGLILFVITEVYNGCIVNGLNWRLRL